MKMKRHFRKVGSIPLMILPVLIGCDYSYEVEPREMDGTYSGTTISGEQIFLTLESSEEGLSGYGTLGQDTVVFVEEGPRKIVGKLLLPDGEEQSVTLAFSEEENIRLDLEGQTLSLAPGEALSWPAQGPYSGYYETRELQSLLEALSLKQAGNIVGGTAIVLGREVLVSGWLVAPDSLHGRIILPDEVELGISATLDDDNNLVVRGLGDPVVFQRR
jgi:hypothetical protein